MSYTLIGLILVAELFLGACAIAYVLYRNNRRLQRALNALHRTQRQDTQARELYATFIYHRLKAVSDQHLRQCNEDLLKRGIDVFETSLSPLSHCLRLHYGYLRHEQKAVEDVEHEGFWQRRQDSTEWLRGCFERAYKAVDHWLVIYHQAKGQIEAAEAAAKDYRRELAELKERLADVEAYRDRFQTLHGEVLSERDAYAELRQGVDAEPARAGELMLEYGGQRMSLDAFLERDDIAAFDARDQELLAADRARNRVERTRTVTSVAGERMSESLDGLRDSTQQQREAVASMAEGLAEDADEQRRQITYYRSQISQLEVAVADSERCIQTLEKEASRRQRQIEQLLAQVEAGGEGAAKVQALEETVDRFSRQAMDLTRRLYEAQSEIERLRQAPPAEPAPAPEA